MLTGMNPPAQITVVRMNHAGKTKDRITAVTTHKGPDWLVARLRYDVRQFGISKRFNTAELHFFRGRTVAVWQFIDRGNTAYRSYYNISEPVSITGQEVSFRDLELDVLRDGHGFRILDDEDFKHASLRRAQLKMIGESLLLILRGIVDKWCSSTRVPLRPLVT